MLFWGLIDGKREITVFCRRMAVLVNSYKILMVVKATSDSLFLSGYEEENPLY